MITTNGNINGRNQIFIKYRLDSGLKIYYYIWLWSATLEPNLIGSWQSSYY